MSHSFISYFFIIHCNIYIQERSQSQMIERDNWGVWPIRLNYIPGQCSRNNFCHSEIVNPASESDDEFENFNSAQTHTSGLEEVRGSS